MKRGRQKVCVRWVVPLALMAGAGVVVAQAQEEGALVYREKIMRVNGASMGAINDVLKFKLPGANEHIAAHAQTIHLQSQLITDAFQQEALSEESRAMPEIWQNWDEFAAAAETLEQETAKLAELAESGDSSAVMAQVRAVGQACGGCHDAFRRPE